MTSGGKRKGAGRPKSASVSDYRVCLALTRDERDELERRAKNAGMTLSAYIRSTALAGF